MFSSFGQLISRSLVTNEKNIIQITSPEKFEGKSTIAANLAVGMAMFGHKTLLIDADMRIPSISKYLKLNPEGLCECYHEWVENPEPLSRNPEECIANFIQTIDHGVVKLNRFHLVGGTNG